MFEFENGKPIYVQIYEHILTQIFREDLKLGDKLPSVRELAVMFTVNPNTIQKVISELEREKIVTIERGKGTFLTQDMNLISELRSKVIQKEVEVFINKLTSMGLNRKEIINEVKSMLSEVENHG